eukprot:4750222-Heterocapsa_arctica.AAC.1
MLWTQALLSMMRRTSFEVRSNTLTAAYSSARPAVCSTPGTTPNEFRRCPSCTQIPQPDLRSL